jgi:hypothetical protein
VKNRYSETVMRCALSFVDAAEAHIVTLARGKAGKSDELRVTMEAKYKDLLQARYAYAREEQANGVRPAPKSAAVMCGTCGDIYERGEHHECGDIEG